MKVIAAPDSFKGSIRSVDAAAAMAAGVRRTMPDAVIDICPVGDGGEGTLDALAAATGAARHPCVSSNAVGDPIKAAIVKLADDMSFIESALAVGPGPGTKNAVMTGSSFGIGEMIACCLPSRTVVVGLGGSATNDGGCGMAQALGYRFLRADGSVIEQRIGGRDLLTIAGIDASDRHAGLQETRIVAACDVDNVLTGDAGAARVYGPQKGADAADVETLDVGLQNLASVVLRDLGVDIGMLRHAGAAGGLGAGVAAFCGAELRSGIRWLLDAVDFDQRLDGAMLCLTGEGRLDSQTLHGKACAGVARAASTCGVPAVAIVGDVEAGLDGRLPAGLTAYRLIGGGATDAQSLASAAQLIEATAASVTADFLGARGAP